ncbi:helix-turn-helix transcriptional regulator [Bacillus sp. PS06]|nr:helix-turn-helix transcriptional regulator [Bacillus sp. PS06]
MLVLLKKGELTTFYTFFEMSKMGVAKHLRILKNAGLINSSNKGQYLYYSLNPIVFRDVLKWLDQFYSDVEKQTP